MGVSIDRPEVKMPELEEAIPKEVNSFGSDAGSDNEIKAIGSVVAALKPLRGDERQRVLEYVLGRFGATPLLPQAPTMPAPALAAGGGAFSTPAAVHDIRSLKENKSPKSANEMAALVAFYLSELAPPAERKQEISADDITRYFKSASFKLSANAHSTLHNAKSAGYLDSGSGRGQFKLNPVGYNLVVHRLGADGATRPRGRNHTKSKQARRPRR